MLWIEMEKDYERFYKKINSDEDIKFYEATYQNNVFYTIKTEAFVLDDLEIINRVKKLIISIIKKYIKKNNIKKDAKILIVGLGNINIKADALGPETVSKIEVTNHLESFKEKTKVCAFIPGVLGTTGIQTSKLIKILCNKEKFDLVIMIDSLKANSLERMNKIIQITNKGITPGSAFFVDNTLIDEKFLKTKVLVIGIPTVVDTKSIVNEYLEEDVEIENNTIVSSKNIDYQIELMSRLLSSCLNEIFYSTKNADMK